MVSVLRRSTRAFGFSLGVTISVLATLRVRPELGQFGFYFRPVARPDLKPLSIKGIYLDSREALPLVPVSAGYHCRLSADLSGC